MNQESGSNVNLCAKLFQREVFILLSWSLGKCWSLYFGWDRSDSESYGFP